MCGTCFGSADTAAQKKTLQPRISNNKRRQILKLMIGIILDVYGENSVREIVRERDGKMWDLFVWLLAMRFYHSIATITKIDRRTKTILSERGIQANKQKMSNVQNERFIEFCARLTL